LHLVKTYHTNYPLASHLHLVYTWIMHNLLKERGLKTTSARIAVLGVFSKIKEPLDASSIYKKIKNKKINEVTVYRTLADFEKSGILRRVDLRKDSVLYELSQEHHHHIVCTNCSRVEEFENEKLEKLLEKIRSSKFRNITEHSLELFGLCLKCS